MRKIFRACFLIGLFLGFGVVGYYYNRQEKLIFCPKTLDQNYEYNFSCSFQEINITLKNGDTINGIHFFHENPKGVMLYLHGQGKNLAAWGNRAEDALEYGYDVFMIDYRGFGKSTDNLTEEHLMEDAIAAYKYLLDRYDEKDIVVQGVSLGTAMASYVSSVFNPKCCILVAPYFNMIETAHYNKPILPKVVLTTILKYHLRTDTWIVKANCPLHIFHGTNDKLIPYSQSEMLVSLLDEQQVENHFYTINGWGHKNIHTTDLYKDKVHELLD